jgi:hypothetical protein
MNRVAKCVSLGLVFGLCAACSSSAGDDRPQPSVQATVAPANLRVAPDVARVEVARGGIGKIRSIVGQVGARVGFAGTDEIDGARLGDEIPVYYTSSDRLREREGAADVRGVLGDPAEMIYPVRVGEETRSAIVLGRGSDGAWTVASVGRAKLVQAIARVAQKTGIEPAAVVLAHGGVEATFVAYEAAGEWRLMPLADVSEADLVAERGVAAREALSHLARVRSARVRK